MAPKHKELRSFGIKRLYSKPIEMTDPAGNVVYSGPASSTEVSVQSMWCAHCKRWVKTNGVMGPLTYMASHETGECEFDKRDDADKYAEENGVQS